MLNSVDRSMQSACELTTLPLITCKSVIGIPHGTKLCPGLYRSSGFTTRVPVHIECWRGGHHVITAE